MNNMSYLSCIYLYYPFFPNLHCHLWWLTTHHWMCAWAVSESQGLLPLPLLAIQSGKVCSTCCCCPAAFWVEKHEKLDVLFPPQTTVTKMPLLPSDSQQENETGTMSDDQLFFFQWRKLLPYSTPTGMIRSLHRILMPFLGDNPTQV